METPYLCAGILLAEAGEGNRKRFCNKKLTFGIRGIAV